MKSSAIAANSKGLREGHVLNRWIEGYDTTHLPWQNIQHNKSLKPTANAWHTLCDNSKFCATLRRLSSTVMLTHAGLY